MPLSVRPLVALVLSLAVAPAWAQAPAAATTAPDPAGVPKPCWTIRPSFSSSRRLSDAGALRMAG